VELQHPDAYKALIAGRSEVTAHFATAPLQYVELSHPTIHRVARSEDVTKGPSTGVLLWTTRRYYEENPKTIRALLSALDEARQFISQRPREAARIYMTIESEARGLDRKFGPGIRVRSVEDFIVGLITGPDLTFEPSLTTNLLDITEFMHRVGRIKNVPATLADLFFPDVPLGART
jgi:NitT/TauT family transport system substrate-binding protein